MITINGVLFDKKIAEMTLTSADITEANRNANGTMFIELIATKDKIELTFSPMHQEEMTRLINALSPITFPVTYTDSKGVKRTGTFYKGDRTFPILFERSGVRYYDKFKISLVEC